MIAGMGQYCPENSLVVSAMPNILKVLPLAILLALGAGATAATAATSKTTAASESTAKSGTTAKRKVETTASKQTQTTRKSTRTASKKPRSTTKRTRSKAKGGSGSRSRTASRATPAPVAPDTVVGGPVTVESGAALVVDDAGEVIYAKNADHVLPIASITKLMTALVVLDARLPLDEVLTISEDDKDYLRNTHSRLRVGSQLTRRELLHIALMSSENRAAAALARTYPAGKAAFIQLMNAKARVLGMRDTRFADSTGLDGDNVSTARDLVKLARAASGYSLIREFTTTAQSEVEPGSRSTPMLYKNSNRLVRGGHWDIQLSKTGYLNEAGRCLLMQAEVAGKPLTFVFLRGPGRQTPMGDANRIRAWLESDSRTS
jgi:D-alanyl-D-alanine endopeptidase (penicillin-binding protein 7)